MKVKYSVNINMEGSQVEYIIEIPLHLGLEEDEWNQLTKDEQQKAIWDDYYYWRSYIIDGGWEILNEDELD